MAPSPQDNGPVIPAELADRELEILVRRLADDLTYGEDSSCYTGSGVDYAQSRAFVPGDPVRDIDWRLTARTAKVHVKEYEALRRITMMLLVDTSASMAVSSGPVSKQKLAVVVAGALGLAGLRRLSPVGVLGAGERIIRHPPSLARGRIFQWIHEVWRPDREERTLLSSRLDQAGALLRSRSLVCVLSDLHDPDALPALRRIAARHDVVVFEIQDPSESGRLRAGFFRAREAETGRTFVAHGRSRWLDRPDRGEELREAGIDHLLLPTDQDFVLPLRQFLKKRGILGRGTR